MILRPAVPLYGYQKRWLLDQARFKIGMFARQTGKTFTTTLEIVDDCFAAHAIGQRRRWVILSRGERQAAEAMSEGVKRHAAAYGLAMKWYESQFDCEEAEIKVKALEVELPGGSRITAVPANPDTARGYSANLFLDEFAIHPKAREIWAACFPLVSKGRQKLRVTSTPKGKGGKFYELMTAQGSTWSKHEVDIYKAVSEGLDRDPDELRAGLADEEIWLQEYLIQFLDEAGAWLTYELITGCEHPDAGIPALYQGGRCYVGVDIARRNDLFVIWVMEEIGDVLWTREIIARQRISFAEQDALLDEVVGRYNVARMAIDQTGMGEKPVEDAQARYGRTRVEGVLMSPQRRFELAVHGKQAFEDRGLRIPEGDLVLRADLHKLQKVAGATGHPRLVATSDDGGHADRTWAAFLATAAAATGAPEYGYIGATTARRDYSEAQADTRGSNYFETDDDDLVARSNKFGAF